MFRFQAAVLATEELERLLELGTDDDDELLVTATLEELGDEGTELLDLLEEPGVDATELLLAGGGVVPQPIGWVETTRSSIHTSALRLLKLWKPNMTKLNLSLIQSAGKRLLFQSSAESTV